MNSKSFHFLHLVLNFINLLFFMHGYLLFSNNVTELKTEEINDNINPYFNFDKVVIIVIDALRADFMNSNDMPLTSNLSKSNGCTMKVKVASPTVTLPRIRALTTGSIPKFTDIFYNLGDPQSIRDSLLHQAKMKGKKIIFYGDNTWLKIFPHMFYREEGTFSFFVTDFYEVDNNVTKNVLKELNRSDWDIMILHYLGLDHIGHVYGPSSSLVHPKLNEMDKIIHNIYTSLSKNSKSLVIVTGDHGMKDGGGHGGATYWETHVPLVILGTSCDEDFINQVDLAPNLACLLDINTPYSSIGQLKRSILKSISLNKYLLSLKKNTELLATKRSDCDKSLRDAEIFYEKFVKTNNISMGEKAALIYENCSNILSNILISRSDQQDFKSPIISVLFFILLNLFSFKNDCDCSLNFFNFTLLLCFRIFCFFINEYLAYFLNVLFIIQNICTLKFLHFKLILNEQFILITVLILQPILWFSSSFIEEEQEFWYFILKSYFVWEICKNCYCKEKDAINYLIVGFLFRFAQTINQTGDKWSSLPDLSDWFLNSENKIYLNLFVLISFICLLCLIYQRQEKFKFFCTDFLILFLIFLFKVQFFNDNFFVSIIYVMIFCRFILSQNLIVSWIELITLLNKSFNIFLIVIFVLATDLLLNKKGERQINSNLAGVVITSTMYFFAGNGNSLSNVDVTIGYIGLNTYNPVLIGCQILINIYSFSVLSHIIFLAKSNSEETKYYLKIIYLQRLYSMVVICIIAVLFRHHISIWTIYAPKLFIEFCHTLILYSEICLYYVGARMKKLFLNKVVF